MHKIFTIATIIILTVLVSACSEESSSETMAQSETLQLGAMKTRAGLEVESGTAIRLILASGTDQVSGEITKTGDDEWQSTARVKKDVQYYIYGFMPANAAQTSSVTALPSGIANGAALTLYGVNIISRTDLSVVVGVQQLTNASDVFNVQMGQFGYIGKDRGQNYAHLLLDRIQSSIHFELFIDNTYSQLRTIKVKQAELLASKGNSCDVVVTLRANNAGTNPITTIDYTLRDGSTDVSIYSNVAGTALMTDTPLTFDANFLPVLKNYLKLKVTYDVYDSKGNYIHTRTAENQLGSALPSLLRGEQTTLTLTVKPTYLYILSDPDLDNPTVTIE